MYRQEIFNKVWEHAIDNQAKPSVAMRPNADNIVQMMCLYRDPEGCRCFTGVLIPDELYSPEFEGMSFVSLVRPLLHSDRRLLAARLSAHSMALVRQQQLAKLPIFDGVESDDATFLHELQKEHDSNIYWQDKTKPPFFVAELESRLKQFATKWDLEIPHGNT